MMEDGLSAGPNPLAGFTPERRGARGLDIRSSPQSSSAIGLNRRLENSQKTCCATGGICYISRPASEEEAEQFQRPLTDNCSFYGRTKNSHSTEGV